MKRILVAVAVTLCAVLIRPEPSAAYNWYYSLVAAHYPLTPRTRACILCHTPTGSESLNAFGARFRAAGADGRAIAAIAAHDADEDGAPNEVELRTGHFPGEAADAPSAEEVAALRAGRRIAGDPEREIFETLQCPCCDKLVMRCQCDMVPEIRRIVHEGVAAGLQPAAIKRSLVDKYGRKILPLAERAETLPARQFREARVANAYRIAAEIPRELGKYPCYCTCYRVNGHLSLLDCYKNEHGARCQICIEEAEVIEGMVRDRSPEAAIRNRIVKQFGRSH
jgi:hypothetical protein